MPSRSSLWRRSAKWWRRPTPATSSDCSTRNLWDRDTVCTGERFEYDAIPMFAPKIFARVSAVDTMKRKQFLKGIQQLSQEGAIQTFKENNIGVEELIVGVVGMAFSWRCWRTG